MELGDSHNRAVTFFILLEGDSSGSKQAQRPDDANGQHQQKHAHEPLNGRQAKKLAGAFVGGRPTGWLINGLFWLVERLGCNFISKIIK